MLPQGGLIMPKYEFICEECSKKFTLTMRVSEYEKKKVTCPNCKSKKVRQLISSFQTITSKKA
jgi:putative FmdB family regulatory protein